MALLFLRPNGDPPDMTPSYDINGPSERAALGFIKAPIP